MIEKGDYWYYIFPSENDRDDGEGKWIYIGKTKECHLLLPKIEKLVINRKVLGALVSTKSLAYDSPDQEIGRICFFTSGDVYERLITKRIIENEIGCKELSWKSHRESDIDWSKKGVLSLKSEIEDCKKRKILAEKAGRYNKVHGINKWLEGLLVRYERAQYNKTKILVEDNTMIVRPVFGNVEYELDMQLCFVVMPINNRFQGVYNEIKQVVSNNGVKCVRADEIFSQNVIMEDIWMYINKAAIVIADISEQNANVFYEIGIAHTLGKKIVLIRDEKDSVVPFDIHHWRHYIYRNTLDGREDLRNKIDAAIKHAMSEIKQ